jgi:hypothetical protein
MTHTFCFQIGLEIEAPIGGGLNTDVRLGSNLAVVHR